jgi:hypothetical protein
VNGGHEGIGGIKALGEVFSSIRGRPLAVGMVAIALVGNVSPGLAIAQTPGSAITQEGSTDPSLDSSPEDSSPASDDETDPEVPIATASCDADPSAAAQAAAKALLSPAYSHGMNYRRAARQNGLHIIPAEKLLRRLHSRRETGRQALIDTRRFLAMDGIGLETGVPGGHYQGFYNLSSTDLRGKAIKPKLEAVVEAVRRTPVEYLQHYGHLGTIFLMKKTSWRGASTAEMSSDNNSKVYLNSTKGPLPAQALTVTLEHEIFHPVQLQLCPETMGEDVAYERRYRDVNGISLFHLRDEMGIPTLKASCAQREQVNSTTDYGKDNPGKEDQDEVSLNLTDPHKLAELANYPILWDKINFTEARVFDSGPEGRAIARYWAAIVKLKSSARASVCR